MAFLDIKDVHKSYGETKVLDGVSISVDKHEVVCLIGASGSGKSTLLMCVNALQPVNSGEILLDGDRVTGRGVDVNRLRRNVGTVFQSYNLFPHMSVLENLMLAPRKVLGLKRDQAEAQALELLAKVGMEGKAKSYPDQLSGGQQQRVAIVRAMCMRPQALLLDEITAALDPELVGDVLQIVRDLATEGMTMVLATHEMGFAREVASQVCFLHQGKILERGKPEDIFENPQEERTRQFLARVLASGRL
jgi:polar amino acid transport system ATP-binding protein